jgi:hypothetical protein
MSIHFRFLIMFGVTLVIPIGIALGNRAGADEPQQGSSAGSSADSSSEERLLLLSNGKVQQGIISEDQTHYQVTQRIGVLKFPKKNVEGVFGSIREIYQYKLQQLPERDSDERLKLAHWCLSHQLRAEAREQLSKAVALNPKNQQAQAMLISIDQAAKIAMMRQRDPEVRQTEAERVDDARPAALSSDVIRGAQSALRISGLPVIFDLPQPLAITRANEFAKYVHPLLQAYCAKCHNEHHDGVFQLVQYKSRADHTSDALRANLDATLRLVDPDNLSRSELLSSTLRPHGRGPNKRPIFPGSNDRAYQVLETWVSQLRLPKSRASGIAMQERAQLGSEKSEVFAANRKRISAEQPTPELPAQEQQRFAPVNTAVIDGDRQGRPKEFPLPFVIGGANPGAAPGGMPSKAVDRPGTRPAMNGSATAPGSTAITAREIDQPSASPDPKLPADETAAKGDAVAAKKPSKPLKLDPSLLQRVLQGRKPGASAATDANANH